MLRLPSWLSRSRDDPHKDARALYQTLMEQSRNPAFFEGGHVDDNFDGRMEVLAMHISLVMAALSTKADTGSDTGSDNGLVLSQALYDVMVADFDVALREEGLADTGVSRRIKPMAKMVLTRAKSYSDALTGPDVQNDLLALARRLTSNGDFEGRVVQYTLKNWQTVKNLPIGDIARSKFEFAEI